MNIASIKQETLFMFSPLHYGGIGLSRLTSDQGGGRGCGRSSSLLPAGSGALQPAGLARRGA